MYVQQTEGGRGGWGLVDFNFQSPLSKNKPFTKPLQVEDNKAALLEAEDQKRQLDALVGGRSTGHVCVTANT